MRILALVDGEHYPAVVRTALGTLPGDVVAAVLLGGREKLPLRQQPDYGDVPVLTGDDAEDALANGLNAGPVDLVYDLADEPVLDARGRMRLAALTLARGIPYAGPDFRFEPPPRPRLATKPSVAVVGTGKRTGKTAVAAHIARFLRERGTPPVLVTMGRGGPPEPELVDPATFDLSPAGLLALSRSDRHAASDHFEDALMAGVVTIGTRRCGGGLAGAPGDDTFAAGVAMANARPESLLVFEGSGSAVPPAAADATICVIPADVDRELLGGYLGSYRVLLSDLVVVTMAETSLAKSGSVSSLERDVRRLARGGAAARATAPAIAVIVFRPFPLEPISGRRVFYATTAPASAVKALADHLEHDHGAEVIGTSHHLANRPALAADLEGAEKAEVLVVELKAAAVDLATRLALQRGMEVVFCDNRVVPVGGDGPFEELASGTVDRAIERFTP
ncbi:MAG: cyclic 2,3-diphosphoglycerate synthase [Actinomycetota bacterium]|nr:cyclic 2,3-diphosphoglycerate synthase [Actinomycetota bacterium]